MSFQKSPSFFADFSQRDMKDENAHYYGFGRFTLDVAEQRLSEGERPIPLTPKAFDVLSLLVENAGHLVEKEELMQNVWPDSFVEEANVAKIVHMLRKRLGDDGNGNTFIETVPTKGYRFVANVEAIGSQVDKDAGKNARVDDGSIESALAEPPTLIQTPVETGHRRHYFVLAAVAVLGVMATGFWISNGSLMPRSFSKFVRHSMNGEAYRHFQQGRSLLEQEHSPQSKQQALEHFERAIEIDPFYAEAYAGKAAVMSVRRDASSANDEISTARAAAKKAITLDPDSAYGHTIYCRIIGTNDWEFEEAVTECKRAVELDPNDAAARRELGLALGVVGRQSEALDQLEAAVAISPTSYNKYSLGDFLYWSRRYDEALNEFEQIEITDPGFANELPWLMLCFAMKNDQAKAQEYLVKTQETNSIDPDDLQAVEAAFVSGGWPAAVRATFDAPTGYGTKPSNIIFADLFADIGEKDKAFEVLDDLRKARKFGLLSLARDPMLDPIRDDPRYSAIISEMNLK